MGTYIGLVYTAVIVQSPYNTARTRTHMQQLVHFDVSYYSMVAIIVCE
jgi:hypothetical protein